MIQPVCTTAEPVKPVKDRRTIFACQHIPEVHRTYTSRQYHSPVASLDQDNRSVQEIGTQGKKTRIVSFVEWRSEATSYEKEPEDRYL